MRRSAVFSRCGRYRYALGRVWQDDRPTVLFIALNPSTADARRDDPTIRRLIGFAVAWGFGGVRVANLFAFRSSKPETLRQVADPIGPRNDWWLSKLTHESAFVVAAWGKNGGLLDRATQVTQRFETLHHLGLTSCGQPRHPLYLPRTVVPRPLDRTTSSCSATTSGPAPSCRCAR